MFLYRHALGIEIQAIEQVPRAKMPHRVPVVLSLEEVGQILKQVYGTVWIVALAPALAHYRALTGMDRGEGEA